MSYNQPSAKQFVKAKPLFETKDKPPIANRGQVKKPYKKYEQKPFQQNRDPRQHIVFLLNQFQPSQRNPNITSLYNKFPKIFCEKPNKPQPQAQANYAELLFGGRKQLPPPKYTKQLSSDQSDPNWGSDEEKQIKLASKKIDQSIVQKVNTALKKEPPKKIDQLMRHEKEFLEEYNRQKRQQQQNVDVQIIKQQKKTQIKYVQDEDKQQQPKNKPQQQEQDAWAEYDPKVGALISEGFIQKIQQDDQDDDFSMEDVQKSQKSSSSSQNDDDMFADQGPRTVTKTKQDKKDETNNNGKSKQVVSISNHFFTQIAEQAGAHPQACTWIISDKHSRYKVSTQYMNEYYQQEGKLVEAFPYVSLNHSEFVLNTQLKTQKGIEKLKKVSNLRRRNQNGYKNKGNTKPNVPLYKQKD